MPSSVLYIGHPYHALTRSTVFMVDLLKHLGPVRVETTDSWTGDVSEDVVFIFQSEDAARQVAKMGKSFIFAPMYDSSWDLGEWFWKNELRGLARVLCFSRKQYERVRSWGLDCFFTRFFPDPVESSPALAGPLKGSFWWRLESLPLDTILKLAGNQLAQLHVHLGADPHQVLDESACERASVPLQITRWGNDRSTYSAASADSQIIFAPRLKEGIGMSFLEAMATGRVVAAPDDATMNEYLTDGVTGFLYDPAAPAEIPFAETMEMGRRARESIQHGKRRWDFAQPRLLNWIAGRGVPPEKALPHCTDGIDVYVKDTGVKTDLEKTLNSMTGSPHIYRTAPPRSQAGRWRMDLQAGDELLVDLPGLLKSVPENTGRIVGHYTEQIGPDDYERRVTPPARIARRMASEKSGFENLSRMPHPSAALNREGFQGRIWHCDYLLARVPDRGFSWKRLWIHAAVRELSRQGAPKSMLARAGRQLIRRDFENRRQMGMSPWSDSAAATEELAILSGIVFDQGVRAAMKRFLESVKRLGI